MSFFNHKGLPQPLLPFWGAERPLTQLLKTAFTFTVSQHTLRQEGREHGVFKQMEQRKYFLTQNSGQFLGILEVEFLEQKMAG